MLSPHEKELLTAYVDGELTAGQSRQVERLLRRSGEARTLLDRLREDSATLRKLPRVPAPVDFSDAVLRAITRKGLKPGVRLRVPTPHPALTTPSWAGLAAAAAVLLLIGLGSFLLHSQDSFHDDGTGSEVASRPVEPDDTPKPAPEPPDPRRTPLVQDSPKPSNVATPGTPDEREPFREDPDEGSGKLVPGNELKPEKPKPSVLTSPENESIRPFERVELGLPVVLKLHELDTEEQSTRLLTELGRGRAFRVELLARDATRGFDRLRAALGWGKIQLLQDPVAHARLKQPRWRTDYGLFVENITAGEAVALLKATGMADRSAAMKKAAEMRFDGSLVVKPISRWDRKELWDLLGVDPVRTRPAQAAKGAVDVHRPLSDDTSEQVEAALEGRGVPRPGASLSATAYLTLLGGPRSRSAELKRFLDGRRPEQPGTVQLFIVLRNVGG